MLWFAGFVPWYIGAIGLLFDALDGYAARKLGAESKFGSLYDWTTDVTFAALLINRIASHISTYVLLTMPVIVPLQVANRLRDGAARVSGRAILFILCLYFTR